MKTIEEWCAEYCQQNLGFDEFCDMGKAIRAEFKQACKAAIVDFANECRERGETDMRSVLYGLPPIIEDIDIENIEEEK